MAVYLLGGKDRFIDTEDVAVKAHELAPGRFSWTKYPELINLEGVRVRLLEEAQNSSGKALIRGSQARGWMLTSRGLAWAQETAKDPDSLLPAEAESRERGGSVDVQRLRRERSRIASCRAWSKWLDQADEISKSDAEEVIRLDSYATKELQTLKLDRLRKMFIDEQDMQRFFDRLENCLKG